MWAVLFCKALSLIKLREWADRWCCYRPGRNHECPHCDQVQMGRQSQGSKLHPDRQCRPCVACQDVPLDGRYAHPETTQCWEYAHHPTIPRNACICKKCMKRLINHSAEPMPVTDNVQPTDAMPAQHVAAAAAPAAPAPAPATIQDCSVDGCDLPRHVTVSLQAVELAEKLNVKVNANDQPAGLCNRHNMQLHDSNRPTCTMCGAQIRGVKRKCPNVGAVQRQLHAERGLTVTADSAFCLACYKGQLDMVDSQTTDFKLESLVQSITDEMHQCTSPEESALLATARFVCLAFLENRSLLLATAADFFTSSSPSIDCNNRWLLSSLISKLGAHLSHGSYGTSKKRGTLLYRTGCDTVLCLYNSLAVARSQTLKHRAQNETQHTQHTSQPSGPSSFVSELSAAMRSQIKSQAQEFKHKEHNVLTSLSEMKLDAVVDSVDSELWGYIWLMMYSQSKSEGSQASNHRAKRIRCLFVLSCMMHASTPACTYPFQLVLSVFVDAHSNSSEVMRVLARVGATAGVDSYKRYQKTIIDKKLELGMNREIPHAKFSIATVDNIDKNEPGKRIYCGDQSRGFHGTFIQSITPKPISSNIVACNSIHVDRVPHQGFHCASQPANTSEPQGMRGRSRARTMIEGQKPQVDHQSTQRHLPTPQLQLDDAVQPDWPTGPTVV